MLLVYGRSVSKRRRPEIIIPSQAFRPSSTSKINGKGRIRPNAYTREACTPTGQSSTTDPAGSHGFDHCRGWRGGCCYASSCRLIVGVDHIVDKELHLSKLLFTQRPTRSHAGNDCAVQKDKQRSSRRARKRQQTALRATVVEVNEFDLSLATPTVPLGPAHRSKIAALAISRTCGAYCVAPGDF